MTRTKRILTGAGVGIVVALLVTAYLASPVLALQNLTAAAKAGDKAKLESAVDFPAVRESLKSQLKAAMTRKFAEDPKLRDNPFAAFGQMLLVGVVDKAVETYATPDAIANMVATNEPPKSISATPGGPIIEPSAPVDPAVTAADPAGPMAPTMAEPKAKSSTEVHYGYQDLNHFRATYRDRKNGDKEPFGLVLERRGMFGWKLVKIELPGLS